MFITTIRPVTSSSLREGPVINYIPRGCHYLSTEDHRGENIQCHLLEFDYLADPISLGTFRFEQENVELFVLRPVQHNS